MAITEDDRDVPPWVENVMGYAVRKAGDRFIPFNRCGKGRYHFFRRGTHVLTFATRDEATAFCRAFRDRMWAAAPKGEYVYFVTPGEYPHVDAMARNKLCALCSPGEQVFEDWQAADRFAQRLRRQQYRHAYPERVTARRISKVDRRELYAEWEASGRQCGICGAVVVAGSLTHIDHVLPVADGGTRDLANLRVTHQRCNATRYYREWRERKS
jgi:5-methylcytosine-specific restriction endonuclease McrA